MRATNNPTYRIPFLGLAILSLLAALWAGLIRIGWGIPNLDLNLPLAHGPLMISGFLGTLIALERAVALSPMVTGAFSKFLPYLGPALSGLGAVLLPTRIPELISQIMITLSGLFFVGVYVYIIKRHPTIYTQVMGLGALFWFLGNLLSILKVPRLDVDLWWAGFLVLTVTGERLELGKLFNLSRVVIYWFISGILLFTLGLGFISSIPMVGIRLIGSSLILLSTWLFRNDIARRTVRKTGVTRFSAICMLAGYFWLLIAGIVLVYFGRIAPGIIADLFLHTLFLGFIMSMIFGHAPIIFPAILNRPIQFQARFYYHLVLLHLSLTVRVIGDLLGNAAIRKWGGLLNVVAVSLFLILTALSLRKQSNKRTDAPI